MSSRSIVDLLKEGLDLHRRGELEQAGRVYGEILTVNPDQAEAMHLLGIVAHQLGDHVSAARAIDQAIALRPGAAHFHVNIGAVYRALGQYGRSAACQLLARRLRPGGFEASDDYDVLIRTDHLPEIPFESMCRYRPIGPGPALDHTNLGDDLLARGDLDGCHRPVLPGRGTRSRPG